MSDHTLTVAAEAQWRAEIRRRQMLNELGLPVLVSRYDAPGAAAAVRFAAPLPTLAPRSEGGSAPLPSDARPSKSGVQAGQSATSAIRAALNTEARSTTRKTASEAVASRTPAVAASAEKAPPVAFQLLIAAAGGWLWVEHLPDQLLRREQLQLIQGMARALSDASAKVQHRLFDWPLANHPHLPRDLGAAQQSVAGQLQRWLQDSQAKGVMVLGDTSQQYVTLPAGLLTVSLPTTSAMLMDPAHKRAAWQQLKPLCPSGSSDSAGAGDS